MVAKDGQLETAPAEIDDAAGLDFRADGGESGLAAKARLLFCPDDFERDARRLFDATRLGVAVLSFARGAGGDGTVFGDAEFVHDFAKMTECFDGFLQKVFGKAMAYEHTFPQAEGIALADERFDIESGIGAGNGQAYGIGAGIDGGNVDRLRHRCAYRQR